MTQVGIGWRHAHYGELLEQRPALDFIEVHSENFFGEGGAALAVLEAGRREYPVSLHGVGLSLGSAAGIDAWHLNQLERLVDRIDPVRVSDHASFARGLIGGRCLHAADLLPLPFNAQALAVLCANVQRVQDRLKRPLLVENLSAYITLAGADRDEPDFLAELARRTGCQLLVDVNNIYVNALNAGEADPVAACNRWLDRIPTGCVGEIHVAGHKVLDDIVIDDHGSRVAAGVWRVYEHALLCFGEVPTLVEWDTDVPALDTLLDEAAIAQHVARNVLQQVELAA
ncbi:MNIO family bufferin maturase [Ramlibacter albus]|uniref:DUF692 domain-containing protein n=1 Tax=Ramlibacter albus TaxID=2079448 RepID=A0A923S5H9_9BURK|nr:DUF692 domain-containing protein [Ramlibacter albus]MBC5768008.1 DUF692 domain-containing protein [Ramlibacter albus]